jgi:hypothetical protein
MLVLDTLMQYLELLSNGKNKTRDGVALPATQPGKPLLLKPDIRLPRAENQRGRVPRMKGIQDARTVSRSAALPRLFDGLGASRGPHPVESRDPVLRPSLAALVSPPGWVRRESSKKPPGCSEAGSQPNQWQTRLLRSLASFPLPRCRTDCHAAIG